MATTTDVRTHQRLRLGDKTPNSRRFTAAGLIVLVQDASFAGEEYEITDIVEMVINAETFGRAYEIADETLDRIQTETGLDDRKQNFIQIDEVA